MKIIMSTIIMIIAILGKYFTLQEIEKMPIIDNSDYIEIKLTDKEYKQLIFGIVKKNDIKNKINYSESKILINKYNNKLKEVKKIIFTDVNNNNIINKLNELSIN